MVNGCDQRPTRVWPARRRVHLRRMLSARAYDRAGCDALDVELRVVCGEAELFASGRFAAIAMGGGESSRSLRMEQ